MNPWPFVIAAYGLTAIGTLWLTAASYAAMRKAERAAEALRRR
jgi:hypothetical protein